MKVVPFAAEHWLRIEWQESQKEGARHVTQEIAELWEEAGDGLTLLSDDGEVIASAAVAPTRLQYQQDGSLSPIRAHAVAAFSPKFSRHIKLILRACRQFLDQRPEEKITMHVWPADTKAARFAKRLGFAFERSEYEPSHQAFVHLYARVRV